MGGGPWDWLTTGCFGVFRCRLGCLVGGLVAFEFFMACYPLERARDVLSRILKRTLIVSGIWIYVLD